MLRRLVAAATILLMFATSLAPAGAQSPTGSGLSISPTLSEYTLKPGQADKLDINLKNITLNKITAQAFVNDFLSDNVSGNPKIITDPNSHSPNSIRRFVIGLEDIPLDIGQQRKVTLAIQVPADTPPGAYFGVVRYKAVPAGASAPSQDQVALSASVGTIVLVTVPGNIREQVQLAALHVYNHQRESVIFLKKPDQAGVEIRNLGNGFVKPFGTVEIQDMFGKEAYSYQLNNVNPRSNILPSSNRIFISSIKNLSKPGRYTITANITYGSGSEVLVLKKTFWYIPLWLMAIIVIILLAIAWIVFRSWRRYRRGERRHRHNRQ